MARLTKAAALIKCDCEWCDFHDKDTECKAQTVEIDKYGKCKMWH